MTSDREIWTEKYRPESVDEVLGQEEITERIQSFIDSGDLPHLLFSGPAGVGKTALSKAIAKDLYGDDWRDNYKEFNASDERGIDVVRDKIKDFSKGSFGKYDYRIIFLDEADALTSDAQAALRRTMEKYSDNVRFILSCNYPSQIIDPIQSRCVVYNFEKLDDDAIAEKLKEVVREEDIKITEEAAHAIIEQAQGDMRRAIGNLQSADALTDKVEIEDVYKNIAAVKPERIEESLQTAVDGDFVQARKQVENIMEDEGVPAHDLLEQMHSIAIDMDIEGRMMAEIIDRIGETEFRINSGGTEKVQVESLIAHISLKSN